MGEPLSGRTATELAAGVRAGRVDAVDVVRAHLERIEAVDPRLGAFQLVRAEAAMAEAAAVDAHEDRARLPLAGVPVAVKDVVDVTGEPTRHGSAAIPAPPATADDPTVARLREAGAIIVGKTRGPELSIWGASDNVFGAALNPWDTTRGSGGSSGGSAAAVAAGLVPLALASDGMGSVRIPAASCGVFGIKPGSEVVPMVIGDRREHWFGMTQYGPIATTVEDAALMLGVLAGEPRRFDVAGATAAPPLRVAVSVRPPLPGPVAKPFREAVGRAGSLLRESGDSVRRADPPYSAKDVPSLLARWTQGAAQDAAELGMDLREAEPRTRAHIRVGAWFERLRPVDPAQAESWLDRLDAFWEENDVLVTPALARTALDARPWHQKSWPANLNANLQLSPFTALWNLADAAAAVVPMGFAPDGLPIAVQIVAPRGGEQRVLRTAARLQAASPWKRHADLR